MKSLALKNASFRFFHRTFPWEEIGNLSMSWNRCYAAWIGEVDVFAMLCPFVGENTSESLQVPNELPSLHSHLELFDHYLVFG